MFWEQLLNGLTLGSTYALIALGYTMVYGIVQLINFAHGEIYMFGAFAGLILVSFFGVNLIVAMLGAMLFCMLLGILVERIAYRPLRGKSSRLSALISAIGVSIFLSTLMALMAGTNTHRYPDVIAHHTFHLGSLDFSLMQILILAVSALLMLGLQFMVQKTRIGKAMRACSQDLDASYLMGINVNRVISFTFAVGSALAAAGGVMVGVYYNAVWPYMGMMAGLKAFAAAVMGGIGSIPGAMIGGLSLGIMEIMGVAYLSSSYKDAIAFGMLILVLLIRPQGLMGQKISKKV
ncbi:MAG: branched-chain amino acid ABC transporter permease [Syntrophomonas sp.]|uniref:branched-chain amino acid ABC transporter permease n=1 Tax=Syntrophomonas sp. TaxID=2053627 RepID=UPI002602B1DA|nr:branched-chain amino acid ABC transporter permease [Syntrophomonas sp.]MDD2510052.1 branched-chain amino acid ABC transporter permease [Syntrophomonas sp.]MDD3879004.1 branched-chain amino acid ABC transporter permease [Syntrophomonas sp.]MDD4626770.1 branched-chain amino acid ABC transporter permease [Syntrophomonas sp.]